mgnify:CR=1 FL=1
MGSLWSTSTGSLVTIKTKKMELNEARKRFETIANKTGILSNQIIVDKFKPGYCLIFTSNHFHKVDPVTSGVRKTLSYWAKGPLWR